MGSLEQWAPSAVQAATAVGQLLLGIAKHRSEQAEDWGENVEGITGLGPNELREAIEADPAAAELVWRALEAAAGTANDNKRYLLAQVAAAALRGDTTPEKIDRLLLLGRAVTALDAPHITLLVLIGELSERVEGTDRWSELRLHDLGERWSGGHKLLAPALTALENEGLIVSQRQGTCRLVIFGAEFLDYLLIDAGGWPPSISAS
jgi:hypothetical protein